MPLACHAARVAGLGYRHQASIEERLLKDTIRQWLFRSNVRPLATVVAVLNRKLRGWGNYFRYASVLRTRHKLDRFVCDRVRHFLVRRNKIATRGSRRYSREDVFGELGVVSLEALPRLGRECPM
jgi:RNA-directed DNA polymerase